MVHPSRAATFTAAVGAALILTMSACASRQTEDTAAEPATATPSRAAVTSATGEVVQVEVGSDQIYSLEEFTTLGLATLGVEPEVGATFFQYAYLEPFYDDLVGEVKPWKESVENVAAERPALILGINHPSYTDVEEQLEGIAPVVFTDFTSSWDDQLRVLGEVTGRSDRAERVIEVIENTTDDLAVDLQQEWAGKEVALLARDDFGTFAYGPTTLAGDLLEQLGFTRSEVQSGGQDSFGFVELSDELLGEEADADVLIEIVEGTRGEKLIADESTVADDPDRQVIVVNDVWEASHALAAWTILHDLRAGLLDEGEITTNVQTRWEELEAAVQH